MRIYKKIVLSLGGLLMLFLHGCSLEQEGAIYMSVEDLRTRETVTEICSGKRFGYFRSDDEYVALQYIYNDPEIAQRYGTEFEVTEVHCITSEAHYIFSLFKGDSQYVFYIGETADPWIVSVEKSYWGKWEVVDCVPENNDIASEISA